MLNIYVCLHLVKILFTEQQSCKTTSFNTFICNHHPRFDTSLKIMIFASSMIGVFLGLAIVTKAHFTLQFPAAIGPYDDTKLIDGPCDGYDPTSASVFQDWPWRGEAVTLLTTHPVVTWDFNAALFSSVTKSQSSFIPLTETLQQNNGTGYLCFGQVPGKKEWVGQKAIVQIIQHAPDGDLTSVCLHLFILIIIRYALTL